MPKLLLAIVLFCLSGCSILPPEIEQHPVKIVWVKVTGEMPVQDQFGKTRMILGRTRVIDGVCYVYAPDPPVIEKDGKKTYKYSQWAILGHEIKHCFDGQFHDY